MTKPLEKLRKRMHLDRDQAWLFGVCTGLANYWHTDPAIVRVGVVVCGLFITKVAIACYLVAWLLLDDQPRDQVSRDRDS
jgi:phage shock protein PspC (stress-responsive transcriptional regulator)